MEIFLHGRNRYDPVAGCPQMAPGLIRSHLSGFHGNNAGDELQAVGDPVVGFVKQHVFLPKQLGMLAFQKPFARDILDAQKDVGGGSVFVEDLPRAEQHRSPSEQPEVMLDFIILHGALFGNDLAEQYSQLGDVPLPAAQLIERPADDIADVEFESRTEGAARGDQPQAPVENQERFAHGVDNSLGDRSGGFRLNEVGWSPRLVPGDRQYRGLSLRCHVCLPGLHRYHHRLRHPPPQLPPHPPLPRIRLMSRSSKTAPIAAPRISETIPEPRWIPSCGNSQLAMKAPATPTTRSPRRPKPVPWTN